MLLKRAIRILKKHFQIYYLYYFILILVLILGIIIGPLIINILDLRTKTIILKLASPYYKIALLDDFKYSAMRPSIFNNIFLILLILLINLIDISIFLIPLIVLIKGILVGFLVGFLVSNFGLKGFLFSIGGIYPQNIFIISGLIGLGATSMSNTNIFRSSHGILRLRYINRNFNENLLLFCIYSSTIILGAIIEGFLSNAFLGMTLDFLIK